VKKEVYLIKGMTCASCSSAVERVTRKMDGVAVSEVNLATNKMTIEYDETKLTPEAIIDRVDRAGFGAERRRKRTPFPPRSALWRSGRRSRRKKRKRRSI